MSKSPVTVVGLGPMGQALAGAFVEAGHPTTVWNRTAAKAEALVARGAVLAPTAADALAASELVIVCVIDYDAVHEILEPGGALKGRTLVNLTADSPERARSTAAWAAEQGADYLDGAIMTPTVTIGTPAAVVLFSGPENVFAAHRSALETLAGTTAYLGADHGRAAAHDVALLDIFWTAMSGIVHAFALAKAENISAQELAPFAQGIVGLLPDIVTDFAAEVDEGTYPNHVTNVNSAAAGMAHIIHAAEDRGIDVGVLRAAEAVARRAAAEGHGADGFSRLTEVLGRPSA
ncbi:NAD(P)-dependent oxidoreductase [Streptomyces stramineus]